MAEQYQSSRDSEDNHLLHLEVQFQVYITIVFSGLYHVISQTWGSPSSLEGNWTCNLQYKTVGGCNNYCTKRMVEILSWDNPAINWCRISQPCSLSDSSIVSPAPAVIHDSLQASWLFDQSMCVCILYILIYISIHTHIYIYIHVYIYEYVYIYIYINIYIYVYTCKSWLSLSNGHIGRLPFFRTNPYPMIHWSNPCFEW